MKRFAAFALGLLFSLSLVPHLTAAQFGGRERVQDPRDRVCVYQDIRYQGWEQCYTVGDEVRSLGGRTKNISSIRVFGRARITVYVDPDFHGSSAEFSADVPDLGLRASGGGHTWNDQIESLKVTDNGGSNTSNSRVTPPVFDRDRNESDRRSSRQFDDGICVYDRPDFEGREQCFSAGTDVNDLARSGNWSDRISSIRVYGRASAVLYRDIGFRGDSIVIDQDVRDLARVSGQGFRNWDRQTSSLAVEDSRRNPGRGRARGRF